jgi:hypothetical protein
MTQEEFLHLLAGYLEAAGIPFMVAGSLGSSYHGRPRATQDVDLVIDPTPEQLDQFLTLIGAEFYVSPEAAREALRRRFLFNVIDFEGGEKADLIIRKDRPFSVEEFRRRRVGTLLGRPLPIASAEDVVLSKLEWDKITPSQRQVEDALHVVVSQCDNLDKGYMRKWAAELGVADKLEELLRTAEERRQGP